MSRPFIAVTAALVLHAVTTRARADECMETPSGASMESRIALASFAWSAADFDALALLSEDPGIFLAPELAESIDAELDRRTWGWLALDRYEALTALGGAVLWCLTPDDPRCAPVDVPTHSSAPAPIPAAELGTEAPPPGSAHRVIAPPVVPENGERPGVRHRVERPPRP